MIKKHTNIDTIIWDWNGTLLNDVETCISCMNILLKDRNMPLLGLERYLEIFTFPVEEYYVKAGFNFEREPFEIPAHQFIDHYRREVLTSPLHDHVHEVLGYLDGKGYIQAILSAMEKEFLIQTMSDKQIMHFFRGIFGIDNHLGAGKTLAAAELMRHIGCEPSRTVIIGDTLHDSEVAHILGIGCILVAHGHQSYERLKKSGHTVVRDLKELTGMF